MTASRRSWRPSRQRTGHVGVTVIEAVGHGREKGITHEYRGRVFESRFLPKAHMTFIVARRASPRASSRAIVDAARTGHVSGRRHLLGLTGDQRHPQPHRSKARGGGDGMSVKELAIRSEHDLGRPRRHPGDVHAGGFRVPRGGPDPHEERRSHRGEERAHPGDRLDRLLPGRVRDRVRRRRQRHRRRLGFVPSVDELLTIGAAPFSWFSAIPGAAGYLFEVVFAAVSLAIVWGAMAERTKLWVYFAFGAVFTLDLLVRLPLDLEP